MNPIRERVLTDDGFADPSNIGDSRDPHEIIEELKSKLNKMNKKVKDLDSHWQNQRDTDWVKLVDRVAHMERREQELLQENDKLKGQLKQLEKEVKELSTSDRSGKVNKSKK